MYLGLLVLTGYVVYLKPYPDLVINNQINYVLISIDSLLQLDDGHNQFLKDYNEHNIQFPPFDRICFSPFAMTNPKLELLLNFRFFPCNSLQIISNHILKFYYHYPTHIVIHILQSLRSSIFHSQFAIYTLC